MKVCYFGIYDPDYSRNRVFIQGLRENGVEVVECRSAKSGIAKYIDLIRKHRTLRGTYHAMIVGYPGQQAAILARMLTRKPIIFNVLVSFYDSLVFDRKTVGRYSFGAAYYWLLDWLSCRLSTLIILDTEAYIRYFIKTFRTRSKKFHRVFIGSDPEAIHPLPRTGSGAFSVHFHGYFNPLQGIPYIIAAASLLESEGVRFTILGEGPGSNEFRRLAGELKSDTIRFMDLVPYGQLKDRMAEADVCLGVFGDSEKTGRVIPNKVFEALAARKAVITSRTPAVEELLVDREHALFCNVSDAADLAAKILELKRDPALRDRIAEAGYRLFQEKLEPRVLGREVKKIIMSVIDPR
jgi:glycosyltransferase involved in cell wall biosynthesis